MWRWADVKMSRCDDEQMWRWEDVKMWGCEDEQMWRWEDVKMSRCEDEKMWRSEDVKMWGCEDEKMWRREGVKMRRCEDEKMWRWEDVKMRRCEGEKMFYRPPLLEEPCAQTLSGKKKSMHKWLDQALCKRKQIFEGTKRQRKDNNLNTRGLADDWQIDGRRKLKSHLEPLQHWRQIKVRLHAMHENFSMTKWWFCLVPRFSVFHTLTCRYWLWLL